jgi:diacylglycerol kinase (ATP)
MRKFLLLYNPISGKGDTSGILAAYENIQKKYKQYSFFTHVTDSEAIYKEAKEIIAKESITDVIIAGGDGTVSQVVNALHTLPVQFGIVPRGSGNGLAFAAGIPKGYAASLGFIMENSISKPTDAFLINNQFACMLAGLGFDAQVAADFADSPARGLSTYIKVTIKNYLKSKSYLFTINAKDVQIELQSFFISIANSNQFGNKFTIAPKAMLDDGLLDIVIVSKMNKLNFLLKVMQQVTGYNKLMHIEEVDPNKSIVYFQTNEVTIGNPNKAPLHIDGETVTTAENLAVKILPHFFKLIRK